MQTHDRATPLSTNNTLSDNIKLGELVLNGLGLSSSSYNHYN